MKVLQYPCYSKSWKRSPKVSISLRVIHKCFSMFLIKDHAHIKNIVYKPFCNPFKLLVYVVNSL